MKVFNTLTRKKELLKPLKSGAVRMYTCGPTVYNFAHIGNLRTYVFEDILKRTLLYNGLKVRHAMNITDVGHLVSDADEGEDKLEVGARREGLSPLEIAMRYEEAFFKDLEELRVIRPSAVMRATDAIPQQIEIIKRLEKGGYIYKTAQALYFDTSRFPSYGKLSGQKIEHKKSGVREEVVMDADKRNPQDFAVWFFLAGAYRHHILHWPSPWGEGFPGWHLECSAISRKLLGQPFDIHTGGVDHIGTHHENEIAQSEAAFHEPLAKVWMHGEFLSVEGGKMSKSTGSFMTLASLAKQGFAPMDFRYLCLTAHYRTPLNFTIAALEAARNARMSLMGLMASVEGFAAPKGTASGERMLHSYEAAFLKAINDDLNMPQALAVAWKAARNASLPLALRKALLATFDKVLGLGLKEGMERKVPAQILALARQRDKFRANKQFMQADALRKSLKELGYEVEDTAKGPVLTKTANA